MNKKTVAKLIAILLLINCSNVFTCAIIKLDKPTKDDAQINPPLITAISQYRISEAIAMVESRKNIDRYILDWALLHMTRIYYDGIYGADSLRLIQLLIAQGANVNTVSSDGNSILMFAINCPSRDNVPLIRLLLENGANINFVNKKKPQYNTALSIAAFNGDIAVINLLLARGADCSIRNSHGDSVLHAAVFRAVDRFGNASDIRVVIERLLAAGIDINAINVFGQSALSTAISNENTNAIKILIQLGANVNLDNQILHNTPLKQAFSSGKTKVAALLLASGAKPENITNLRITPEDEDELKDNKKQIRKLIKKEPKRRRIAIKKWRNLLVNEISDSATGDILPPPLVGIVADYAKFRQYEDLPVDNALMISTEASPTNQPKALNDQDANKGSYNSKSYIAKSITIVIAIATLSKCMSKSDKNKTDNPKKEENGNKQPAIVVINS